MTDPAQPVTPSGSGSPPSTNPPPADTSKPPSLTQQIGRTRTSFAKLFQAHIALLRAELDEILAQVKVIATQAGIALGMAFMTATLLYVGGTLFLGEWLFGSMGWGLAHGVLLGVGIIVTLVLAILGARARSAVASFIVALVVIFGVAFLCGSNAAYDLASQASGGLVQPLGTPGVVALLAGIVVGAILFMLLLARVAGRGGAIGGFFLGALLGALLGWLIAGAPWTWQPAFGFAITIGLMAWPILNLIFALPGLDPEARFAKLYPRQSIESFEETRAFLEEQWASRRPMSGRK
jgi:hypothetical protein